MTMKQFEVEESRAREARDERNALRFKLTLTADEVDWLLFQIMRDAEEFTKDGSEKKEIRDTRNSWWDELARQGYELF